MKGVILAGGTGSRLLPLTKVTNKHLLPVGRYPMIYHPIEKLVEAGVTDIMIITGRDHMGDVVNLLGSGKDFNCDFTYRVQDDAGGIAQAVGLARGFVGADRMVVILGDNVFEDSIAGMVQEYERKESGAMLVLKEVDDPGRFGVAELVDDKIVGIVEKPAEPKSNYAVTGIYMLDGQAFEIICGMVPSGRGELEITDVNNAYIERGQLAFAVLEGWWTDAGTHASLARAHTLAQDLVLDFQREGMKV